MENKVLIEVREAGKGREENPFLRVNGNIPEDNLTRIKYELFECAVLTYPAFQQDGKTPLEPGRYEVELVNQFNLTEVWRDCTDNDPKYAKEYEFETRQIYRSLSPSNEDKDRSDLKRTLDNAQKVIDGLLNSPSVGEVEDVKIQKVKSKDEIVINERPDILIEIIEDFLFGSLKNEEWFKRKSPELKREVIEDYIKEKIYLSQF